MVSQRFNRWVYSVIRRFARYRRSAGLWLEKTRSRVSWVGFSFMFSVYWLAYMFMNPALENASVEFNGGYFALGAGFLMGVLVFGYISKFLQHKPCRFVIGTLSFAVGMSIWSYLYEPSGCPEESVFWCYWLHKYIWGLGWGLLLLCLKRGVEKKMGVWFARWVLSIMVGAWSMLGPVSEEFWSVSSSFFSLEHNAAVAGLVFGIWWYTHVIVFWEEGSFESFIIAFLWVFWGFFLVWVLCGWYFGSENKSLVDVWCSIFMWGAIMGVLIHSLKYSILPKSGPKFRLSLTLVGFGYYLAFFTHCNEGFWSSYSLGVATPEHVGFLSGMILIVTIHQAMLYLVKLGMPVGEVAFLLFLGLSGLAMLGLIHYGGDLKLFGFWWDYVCWGGGAGMGLTLIWVFVEEILSR